jgi:hypothetical protein
MLKPIHFFAALIIAGAGFYGHLAHTNSGGPNNGLTGAPGEGNCSQCHGAASPNAAKFQISTQGIVGVANFSAGERIVLRIDHLNPPTTKNGFEVTAVNNAGTRFGTLEIVDQATTQLSTAGGANGKQYIKQTSSGATLSSWNFAWNAPAQLTDTGSVRFFAAGNQSNNRNGADPGDAIYLANLRLPQRLTAVTGRVLSKTSVKLFPNPCADAVHIEFEALKAAPVVARLYNTAGVLQDSRTFYANAGSQTLRWAFDTKPAAGTYILRLSAGGYTTAQQLVVN